MSWNFADVWETVASLLPDAPAQMHADRRLTWRDFDRRADGVARALLDAGLQRHDKVASFLSVKPNLSYHTVTVGGSGHVTAIQELRHTSLRINAGYFIFKKEIFDYMQPGEELVVEPFQRLVQCQRLMAYEHDGFFMAMDTFKDRQVLEDILAKGNAPWEVWNGVTTRDA